MSALRIGLTMALKDYPGYKTVKRTLGLWRDGQGIEAIVAARLFEALLWLIGWDGVEVTPVSEDQILVTGNDDYSFEITKKGHDHRRGSDIERSIVGHSSPTGRYGGHGR